MKKKIDVLIVKLTVHIPLDRPNAVTVIAAYEQADRLEAYCSREGRQVSKEQRITRVPAWESGESLPPATDDGLDIPEPLRRTAETEPAAAT